MPKQFLVKKPKSKDELEEPVLDQQVPSGNPYSYYHPAFFYHQPEYFSYLTTPTVWNRYPDLSTWGKSVENTTATAPGYQQPSGIPGGLNLPQPLNLPQQMTTFGSTNYLNQSAFNPTNTQQATTALQSADVQFQQDFQRYINQQHVNAQLQQAQQQAQQQTQSEFASQGYNETDGKVKRDLYNEFFDLDSNALKKEDGSSVMLLPNAVAAALSGRLKRDSMSSDDSKCSESSSAAVVDGIINSGVEQGLIIKTEKDLNGELSPKDEEGEKIYQCEYCTKKFSRSWNYQRHVLIHSGRKPHKCDVCHKAFVLAAHLKIHMRIHTGEKPYKCTVCGRGFAQLTNLQRHALTHTGQKPHRCQHCNKGFVSSSDLRRHIRIHTGEKPYKCHACSKAFTTSGNLQSHVLTHTGVKPYSCNICKWKFISSSNLRTHIRTHHNIDDNGPHDNLQMVPDTTPVVTPSSDQENQIFLTQHT